MIRKVNFITKLGNCFLDNGMCTNKLIKNLKKQGFQNIYQKTGKEKSLILSTTKKDTFSNVVVVVGADNFVAQKMSVNKYIPSIGREYNAEKIYSNPNGMRLKEVTDKRTSNKGVPSVQSSSKMDFANRIKTIISKIGFNKITTTESGNVKTVVDYSLLTKKSTGKIFIDGQEFNSSDVDLFNLL